VLEREDISAETLTGHISYRMPSMTLRPLHGHGTVMEGSAMSLSAWEQQALDAIRDGLASSDPTLVARLTMFTRLASGEEMPAREKVRAGSGRATRRSRPRRTRKVGLLQVAVLLWLAITMALVAVTLAFSRSSHAPCAGSWAPLCGGVTSAPHVGPGHLANARA
jgi:hypothetical protein